MKKVLFTATVDSHILHFHTPFLRMFKEKGYEVHVATNGEEDIPYCDAKHVVSFERSPIKPNNIKAIKQLKKIINKEDFEIIHCHTPMGAVVTRLASKGARKKGTKVIYTAHGFHFFKGAPIFNWLVFYPIEKYLSKYTDCLITINDEDYNLAKKKFRAKKTELIYGVGVNEKFSNIKMTEKEKNEARKSLKLKKEDFVLIQIGELNKNKNQTMSISAIKDLTKEYPDIHLLIVGTGEKEKEYKQEIEKEGLSKNIHMLGYRKDIPELIKISDLLLSLSYREGLPVNVMEGLTVGIPAIVTSCRGNKDLIIEGKNGYIIENRNIEDLKNRIIMVYKSTKNNFKYETEKYQLKNIIKKYEKIYNTI